MRAHCWSAGGRARQAGMLVTCRPLFAFHKQSPRCTACREKADAVFREQTRVNMTFSYFLGLVCRLSFTSDFTGCSDKSETTRNSSESVENFRRTGHQCTLMRVA